MGLKIHQKLCLFYGFSQTSHRIIFDFIIYLLTFDIHLFYVTYFEVLYSKRQGFKIYEPVSPSFPRGPRSPWIPGGPWSPIGPIGPFSPGSPGSPRGPSSPFLPCSPGIPLGPCLPHGPGFPEIYFQKIC